MKFFWKLLIVCCYFAVTLQAQESESPSGWLISVADSEIPPLSDWPQVSVPSKPPLSVRSKATAAANRLMATSQQAPERVLPTVLDLGLQQTLPASDMALIKELARGLDYDWEKCYYFVRNHINYVPCGGIMRGPERTLLDREGNDADQAFLLLALLRASGYTATILHVPLTQVSGQPTQGFCVPIANQNGELVYNAADWLGGKSFNSLQEAGDGVAQCLQIAKRSLRGITDTATGIRMIVTDHFWVSLTLDGETKWLDPSFKPVRRTSVRSILDDMGYQRNSLLQSANGVVNPNSVSNLTFNGIKTQLGLCVDNLRTLWADTNINASAYVGKVEIVEQTDSEYFHGSVFGTPSDFLAKSQTDKNGFRVPMKLNVSISGPSANLYLDEVGPRRLWVSYVSGSGSTGYKTALKLDTITLAEASAASTAIDETMTLEVNYFSTKHSANYSFKRALTSAYAIVVGFGGDHRDGMRVWTAEQLANLRVTAPASDIQLVAASLQVAGHQWLAQTAMMRSFRNKVFNYNRQQFYNIGVAGQASSPYVDVRNSYSYTPDDVQDLDGGMLFSSALEHAVLDQLNGTNRPAVSTIKVLELANTAGVPVYFATSANYATIRGSLLNYTTDQLASFATAVGAGRKLLVPRDARIRLKDWTGYGYIEQGPASIGNQTYTTSMAIGGGFAGGYAAVDNFVLDPPPAVLDHSILPNAATPEMTQADPVTMPAGAYIDSSTDIADIGAVPVIWTRQYDSRKRYANGPLGRGWIHNYEASVTLSSDPDAIFGHASLEAVLPTVVAMAAVEDMLAKQKTALTSGEQAKCWMVAALTVQWWVSRFVDATAVVNLGNKTLSFQARTTGKPQGEEAVVYVPYPGVTATLVKKPLEKRLHLIERLGATFCFDETKSNRLAEIVHSAGSHTELKYDTSGKLSIITNSSSRTALSVKWNTANRIVGVTNCFKAGVGYTYDSKGCLTQAKDALGQSWISTYDPVTCALIKQTDPDNKVTISNTYNTLGQVTNQISAIGQPWRFGYIAGTAAWDEDPLGYRLMQHYDSEGRVLQRIDRDGGVIEYVYDGHGHLIRQKDPLGLISLFNYDQWNRLISQEEETETLKRRSTFVYDDAHHLIETTNTLGDVTKFGYDAKNNLSSTHHPDGTRVTNIWTTTGLVSTNRIVSSTGQVLLETVNTPSDTVKGLSIKKTVIGVGLPVALVETYTYTNGLIKTKVDGSGQTDNFTYNARGQMLTQWDSLNKTNKWQYSNAGHLKSSTDKLNRTTTYLRTASGELAAMVYPDKGVVTNIYDAVDRLIRTRDARGGETVYTRDAMGRVLTEQTETGTTKFVYDAVGNVTNTLDGVNISTRTIYDTLYRPIGFYDGANHLWQTGYDLADRSVSTVDPLGKTRKTLYDAMGRVIATVKPSCTTNSFGYDDLGFQTTYINAEGNVYTMIYDALGRKIAVTNALGQQMFRGYYDGSGNLTNSIDGNGTISIRVYDKVGRLLFRDLRRGTETAGERFTYDAVGNILTASNLTSKITTTFTYDTMNRLISATNHVPAETMLKFGTVYRRDVSGLVTNILYAAGKSVTRQYDLAGRLVSVSDWLGHTWTFTYDDVGRSTGGTSPGNIDHSFSYDNAGRLKAWNVGGTIAGRTIERDAAGKRIQDTVIGTITNNSKASRYGHYTFDKADRMVSGNAKVNLELPDHISGHKPDTPLPEQYDYDGNGALTNIAQFGRGGSAKIEYTLQGQLQFVNQRNIRPSSLRTYDALENTVVFEGGIHTTDHADPFKRPLVSSDLEGVPNQYYIWGEGRLLGFIDSNGTLTIAHSDEQGSIVAWTDLNGNVVNSNPTPFDWLGGYGVRRIKTVSPVGSVTYSFYATRYRVYSATHDRFISPDPLGLDGGLNLYMYCEGNPLAYIDPLGLCGNTTMVTIGVQAAVGIGGTVSLGAAWDSNGNRGLVFSVGLGTGVDVGIPVKVVDRFVETAITALSKMSFHPGTLDDMRGWNVTASAAVLLGTHFDMSDIIGRSKPEAGRVTGVHVGFGGGVYVTRTFIIPLP